jgi:hypothetical protein
MTVVVSEFVVFHQLLFDTIFVFFLVDEDFLVVFGLITSSFGRTG